MKKKFCAVLALLLLLAQLPTMAAGAEVTVALGSVRAKAGETVLVPLTLDSAVDINSVGVTGFTYDKSVLTFNGFVEPGELTTSAALPSLDDAKATVVLGYMTPGKLKGKICALSFTVAAGAAAGDYAVTFTPNIKNSATAITAVEAVAGKVTVGETQTPPEAAYTLALSLLGEGGGSIQSIPAGPFWASVSITKNANADCGVLLATYTKDGRFLELLHANVRSLSVGQSFTLDFHILNPQGEVGAVKAFTLSSLESLTPLGPAVSIGR